MRWEGRVWPRGSCRISPRPFSQLGRSRSRLTLRRSCGASLARDIVRLQQHHRSLAREMRIVNDELRARKRELKALAASLVERRPDTPPRRKVPRLLRDANHGHA